MAKSTEQTLLIIEDDKGLLSQLRWCFDEYNVVIAEDKKSAINSLRRFEPAVVTLDLGLPPDPSNASIGLETLQEILTLAPTTKVIVVTGNDDHENALKAIGLGAYDFYQKPIDPDVLKLIIDRAINLHALETDYQKLLRRNELNTFAGIIAASPQMMKVCRTIEKIAPTDATTLILGESGTGKELVAKALHNLSSRAEMPFVALNCAAIPENLLESELFGYEKGAFTGAVKQTIGKIEYAEGGTFFLDEVGDLSLPLQAKLLRFLQERIIERVGGRQEIAVDVRVLCATHKDLQALITEKTFREDLYYRISEIAINIPALRERTGDALLLAQNFLERASRQSKQSRKKFSDEAKLAIQNYPWPGNVRELENKVKRSVIMADSDVVTSEDLDLEVSSDVDASAFTLNIKQAREQAELSALRQALSLCGNNISQAAELLGISRPTLYDLMKKFGYN